MAADIEQAAADSRTNSQHLALAPDDLEGLDFRDQYTEATAQIIEAKREHHPLPEAPEPEEPRTHRVSGRERMAPGRRRRHGDHVW
ncbi:hypothetical protein [Streptomyces sp. NPDC053069]|uniref:hypothetical protein n=1 Tax=Streptomyces sp. NPDC053069 TaxID=3365695 RepID=UPI0037CEDAF7